MDIMKKALLFLADGFEESEAIVTHDILSRSHEVEILLASISSSLEVTSSMGVKMKANVYLKNCWPEDYDFFVLPGGKLGVQNLKDSPMVLSFLKKAHEENKPIYAICAAPSILGELGFLDDKKYTCFPGFEGKFGDYQKDLGVVNDQGQITGRSMYFTLAFAEEILKQEVGPEAVKAIYHGTRGADYQDNETKSK